MRLVHFEQLAPVCPVCRTRGTTAPLNLHRVDVQVGDDVIHGALVCSNPACLREHPIIDGIPIVVLNLGELLSHQGPTILQRDDLPATTLGMLGDAFGAGAELSTRWQHLSTYGMGHYGDLLGFDSTILAVLNRALAGVNSIGRAIDMGCSVGRTTLELAARTDQPVVGVDLNFAMLKVARQAQAGNVRFPVRQVGVVFEDCAVQTEFGQTDNASFWCADVTALPFVDDAFDFALSLNVVDIVSSPHAHLVEMGRVLQAPGQATIATPFDWSPNAVAMTQWLGGHSARGASGGHSEPALHRLFDRQAAGANWVQMSIQRVEESVPWRVYVHRRAQMEYTLHMISVQKQAAAAE